MNSGRKKTALSGNKKRTHLQEEKIENPIHEAMKIIVPALCNSEQGKQFFSIMAGFTGYHEPTIYMDENKRIDKDAMLYTEGMRNTYRFMRGFMPKDLLAVIEHGIYSHNEKRLEKKETDDGI